MDPPAPSKAAIRIGALAPLSRPGWVGAGRHLLAGLELAVQDVNTAGGIDGCALELVVRDTAGDPHRAAAAVEELGRLGVAAVAGTYHSVVARAVAAAAEALGLPFLCSSAVLDALTDHPADRVARLSPPQSRGWTLFAEFLLHAGHREVAVAIQPGIYWSSGVRILRDRLDGAGGVIVEYDMRAASPQALCDRLAGSGATALLLLVGEPEPAVSIVKAVRNDARLAGIKLGAPAGQPEFAEWMALLGNEGAAIPFLRYRRERLGATAPRSRDACARCWGKRPPSWPWRATTRLPYSPNSCGPAATTAQVRQSPGHTSRWKAPAGVSGSAACQASPSGNGRDVR